jgi:hypothetical protein
LIFNSITENFFCLLFNKEEIIFGKCIILKMKRFLYNKNHTISLPQEMIMEIELNIHNVKLEIEKFSPKFIQKIRNEYLRRLRQLHKSKKQNCPSNSIQKSFSTISSKYHATMHAFRSLAQLIPNVYLVISIDENPYKYISPVLTFQNDILKDLRYQCLKEDIACFKNCHIPFKKKLYRKLASLCVDKNELRCYLSKTNSSYGINEKNNVLVSRIPFHYQRCFDSITNKRNNILENTAILGKIENADWLVKLKAISPLCKLHFCLKGVPHETYKLKHIHQNYILAETSVLLESHLDIGENKKILNFKVAIPFSSLSLDQYASHITKANEEDCIRQFRTATFNFTLDLNYQYPHIFQPYFPLFCHYWFLSKPPPYKIKKSFFYQTSFHHGDYMIMETPSIDSSFYLMKKCYLSFLLITFWKDQFVHQYIKLYQWENPRESLAVIFLAIPLCFPRFTLGLLFLYTACFLFYLYYFFPTLVKDPFSQELNQLKNYGTLDEQNKDNDKLYNEALLRSFNSLMNSTIPYEIRLFLYLACYFLKIIFPCLIYFHTSFTGYSLQDRQEFYTIALQTSYMYGDETFNLSTASFSSASMISSSQLCESNDSSYQELYKSHNRLRQIYIYFIYFLFVLSLVILFYPTKATSFLLGFLCFAISYYSFKKTFLIRIIIVLFQCCHHINFLYCSKCLNWLHKLY